MSAKKKIFSFSFFLLALCASFFPQPCLFGEPIPLSPSNLNGNWWEYFAKNDSLNHLQLFLKELNKQAATLNQEDKKKAEKLLEELSLHFEEYKQAMTSLPVKPSPPILVQESYTLFELIGLWKKRQSLEASSNRLKMQVAISAVQKQNLEEEQQILRESYKQTEEDSVSQFLAALALLSGKLQLEASSLEYTRLEQQKQAVKSTLSSVEQALQAAQTRLFASTLPLTDFQRQENETSQKEQELNQLITDKKGQKNQTSNFSNKLVQELELSSFEIVKALLEVNKQLNKTAFFIERTLRQVPQANAQAKLFLQELETFQSTTQIRISKWNLQANNAISALPEEQEENIENAHFLAQANLLKIKKLQNALLLLNFLEKTYINLIELHPASFSDYLFSISKVFVYGWSQITFYLKKELFKIGGNSVTFLNILYFLFILVGTFWLSHVLLGAFSRIAIAKKSVKRSLVYTISRLIHYILLGIGFILALSALGFDFSNLVLLASALGIGLGFGLQSIFNNFISGIIILFENYLKVGDYIELESGLRGEVREINVRSTVVTDNDGIDILIPNSEIINHRVLNWTMNIPYRRYHIPFSVAYGSDKELVAKTVKEATLKAPQTLIKIGIPEPSVRITGLGDNGIEFELVVWVNEKYTKRARKVQSDYLWLIESALRKEGISIPYPRREIRVVEEKASSKKIQSPKT